MDGGILNSLARSFFSGESFFFQVRLGWACAAAWRVAGRPTRSLAATLAFPPHPRSRPRPSSHQVVEASRPGEALMAPIAPGEIVVRDVAPGAALLMKRGAYLACGPNVNISTAMQRNIMNSAFSGTGLFILRADGSGPVAFSSYGTVHCFDLQPGERRCVVASVLGSRPSFAVTANFSPSLATRSRNVPPQRG